MIRTGATFLSAALGQIEMRGCATQVGTITSSRLLSKAIMNGLLMSTVGSLIGALRMTRTGSTLPFASDLYAVAVWLPKLATHTSWFTVSTATPFGLRSIVRGPLIIRIGAESPCADVLHTLIESPA